MPKVKTNSGAKKRFTLTGTGKIKRKHAYKSHILTKKTKKQKRNLTHVAIVDQTNMRSIREMLLITLLRATVVRRSCRSPVVTLVVVLMYGP